MKRYLIVNPFGIGDVLFSTVLCDAIKEQEKSSFVGFLGNARTAELLRLHRYVDKGFVFERDEFRAIFRKSKREFFKKLSQVLSNIRKEKFDIVVDLSLGRQYSLFLSLIGIKKRVGFDYKGRGFFLTHKRLIKGYQDKPVAEYYLDLLPLVGLVRTPRLFPSLSLPMALTARGGGFLQERSFDLSQPVVGLAPGGGKSWGDNAVYKQWNPERFAQVIDKLCEENSAQIILFGSEDEKPLVEHVMRMIPHRDKVIEAVGLGFSDFVSLVSQCDLFIGNDSGPLHLAAALKVPVISLFGPTNEKVYGPYTAFKQQSRIIQSEVSCRPCYQNFNFPPCKYERQCLEKISVAQVYETALSLLNSTVPGKSGC